MAGESAQREFERLRRVRAERVRASRLRIVLSVGVAFVLGWLAPIVVVSFAMSMVEAVAAGGEPTMRWHQPPVLLSVTTGFGLAFGAAASLIAPSRAERAWGKGALGERVVGAALEAVAAESAVAVLHDRRMPRSRANIDHLAVAPSGVFTIDAKRYAGRLELRARGNELWIAGRNRSTLLEQARTQARVVREALSVAGLEDVPVTPALCFVGTQMSRLFPPRQAGGVLLTTPQKLRKVLTEGDSSTVGTELHDGIVAVLEQALPPADAGRQGARGTASASDAEAGTGMAASSRTSRPSSVSPPACGRCGAAMVVRQRRSDGASFLGCSGFPSCRNTRHLPDTAS